MRRGLSGLAKSDLTIYHVPHTRGFRVIWLCEELGLPYRLARVDFAKEARATPEWRQMNPVGKVPVMTDGEGFKLFESGAMVQHILNRYGDGRLEPPPGSPDHGEYLQWSWFAEATFSRATGEIANHRREFAGRLIEPVLEEMRERARSCAAALDERVATRPFLLGDAFSASDIMMGYALQSFDRNVGEPLPPNASAYKERLVARPAYKAAALANLMASE
jgi:glutathione S-transferase